MKVLLLSGLLLCAGLAAGATTYYVSSISGNDAYSAAQAQNQATPWRTIAKVNSIFGTLNPGDAVMLQAGSVFTGPLLVTRSGTASQLITISTYGSGAAPVISGFANLSGWVSVGGNIWQAACTGCGVAVNMVAIDDSSQYMGRYPNVGAGDGGYAQVQSFVGTTSITDSHLGSGPNWTGAQVVIRKNHWIIEADNILSQSGNTITYQNQCAYEPTVKFGYFIQNSVKTLDVNGEWYYDPVAKKMNLYSTTNPAGFPVQASMIDTLVTANYVQYVHLNGINFIGANKSGMSFLNSNFISLTNCSIRFSGIDAIDGLNSNNMNVDYVTIDYSNSNAIVLTGNGNMVQDCTIQRTAIFPGVRGNPLNDYQAILINGNNNLVTHNSVKKTGYSGICFQGTSNTVINNLVDTYCFVKDDGGGIYTWEGNLDNTQSKVTGWITGNIVVNGITIPAGTDRIQAGIAHGIYLDENTTECYVTGNTVWHCTAGVFYQDSRNCTVQNNTLFDNRDGQIIMRHNTATGILSGNDVSGNFAVTYPNTEYAVEASSIGTVSILGTYGNLHDNYYAQIASSSTFYLLAFSGLNTTGSFGSWQTTYGKDVSNSTLLPVSFPPYKVNSYIGGDMYKGGSIILPFLDALLGVRVITSTGVGAIDSGCYYVLNYTMAAPDNAHTMLTFLEENVSPYYKLSSVVSTPTASPSSNNTVVWQATGNYPNSLLVFQLGNNVPTLSVSNITMYRATVTPNNPAQDVFFQYNASKSTLSVPLSGTWEDASGTPYSGTVQIPPYGSILLIAK
jgi:parallel beta-helix repeat protein